MCVRLSFSGTLFSLFLQHDPKNIIWRPPLSGSNATQNGAWNWTSGAKRFEKNIALLSVVGAVTNLSPESIPFELKWIRLSIWGSVFAIVIEFLMDVLLLF